MAKVADEYFTPEQVADKLQVGRSTIYRAINEGRLPFTKFCGRWRIANSELAAILEAGKPVPKPRVAADPMPRPRRDTSFDEKVRDLRRRRGLSE